ncbi:MAG: MarC family protein [Chloroflexi bacterium]|nr:MarC family protein [Chloroflexota bacterium]
MEGSLQSLFLQSLREMGLSFVPLFVAIDPVGAVPVILALFAQATPRERTRMVHIGALTAGGVGLFFLLLGRFVLALLSISVAHFAIAGGLILLVLALRDIVSTAAVETPIKEEMVEVVPIGTPLLAGPATVTTLLLLTDLHGIGSVLAAFAANLLLAWIILGQAARIAAFLGQGGLRAVSKISYMFLAAIGVRMVIQGTQAVLR